MIGSSSNEATETATSAVPTQICQQDSGAAQERLRQTELMLNEMWSAAIAADQRAYQFCAISAVALTLAAQAKATTIEEQFIQFFALVCLAISCAYFAFAARPKVAISSGQQSAQLHGRPLDDLLDSLSQRNDKAITEISQRLNANADIFRGGLTMGAIGLFLLIFQVTYPFLARLVR